MKSPIDNTNSKQTWRHSSAQLGTTQLESVACSTTKVIQRRLLLLLPPLICLQMVTKKEEKLKSPRQSTRTVTTDRERVVRVNHAS